MKYFKDFQGNSRKWRNGEISVLCDTFCCPSALLFVVRLLYCLLSVCFTLCCPFALHFVVRLLYCLLSVCFAVCCPSVVRSLLFAVRLLSVCFIIRFILSFHTLGTTNVKNLEMFQGVSRKFKEMEKRRNLRFMRHFVVRLLYCLLYCLLSVYSTVYSTVCTV